tara:strand:+ start:606 stop:884 length:279 start_codon:yes stop_codon:yes gene_type:complete
MSLNSFFDTLDTDAKFNAWRKSINSKLVYLKNIIPIENRDELNYVGETLQLLNKLTPLSSDYVSNNPDTGNKEELIKRLKTCNSFYKTFGNS